MEETDEEKLTTAIPAMTAHADLGKALQAAFGPEITVAEIQRRLERSEMLRRGAEKQCEDVIREREVLRGEADDLRRLIRTTQASTTDNSEDEEDLCGSIESFTPCEDWFVIAIWHNTNLYLIDRVVAWGQIEEPGKTPMIVPLIVHGGQVAAVVEKHAQIALVHGDDPCRADGKTWKQAFRDWCLGLTGTAQQAIKEKFSSSGDTPSEPQ